MSALLNVPSITHLHPTTLKMDRRIINKNLPLPPSLFSCFLFYLLTAPIYGASPPIDYIAIDNITLDCGSQSQSYAQDQRLWLADTNSSKVFTLRDEITNNATSSKISKATQQPQSQDQVPYLTARVSFSQFTYSFSVTSGQKFIRLYFYSTSYPGFEDYFPFFMVKAGKAGRFTLLNNFTATNELDSDTMMKEFCIDVGEDEKLDITFIPSSKSYAFVNGIEIVSMPTNLYYTDTYGNSLRLLGGETVYPLFNETALELMYRINVGGNGISPANDTGMYRKWDPDVNYLTVNYPTSLPDDVGNVELKFTAIHNYTAPDEVYMTARSMGPNKTVNVNNNLTWTFPVDSGFTYLIRLHFCEFLPYITTDGDRVFKIYIATFLADGHADVIGWTGDHGNGIPTYKDYAVLVGNIEGTQETTRVNLLIQLHPAEEWKTKYSDVILNGLEIFKTSSKDDLAGYHLYSAPRSKPNSVSSPSSSKNKSKVAIIVGVIGGVVVLFCLAAFLIFGRQRKVKEGKYVATSSEGRTSWWDSFVSFTGTNKSTKSQDSVLPMGLCRYFTLAEIKEATNNFDKEFVIGVGGFGNVYKGFISSISTEVAIKRLKQGSEQGANEFKTEIEMLSQLRHLHLVSLIGYCKEDEEMILVYDYMSRGTLRDHLYNTANPPLSWVQRLEICIGSARGLHYLHSGAKQMIIHRDVKSTNILLDERWVAKVSDFGLSKIGPNNAVKPHISTAVKGSFGYLDPEYYRKQQLTEKSDVYSFGVVLCEVLCARPPINRSMVKKPVSLVEWFRQSYRNAKLGEIIDPYLNGKIAPECLKQYAEVAVRCLADNGIDRPSMSDVVWGLEFALQLQKTAKEQAIKMREAGKGNHGGEEDNHSETELLVDLETHQKFEGSSTCEDDEDLFSVSSGVVVDSRIAGMTMTTSTSEDQSLRSICSSKMLNSGQVFSEFMNPDGR